MPSLILSLSVSTSPLGMLLEAYYAQSKLTLVQCHPCRTCPLLALSPCIWPYSSRCPSRQLRQDHHNHCCHPRYRDRLYRCCSIRSARPSEPQPLGRNQLDRRPALHQWPHVQPHPQGPLRCRRRQGRCFLLRRWFSEPIRSRDSNCCCDV